MKLTRELPCTPVVDGRPTMCAFTGEIVGEFFVHHSCTDVHREAIYANGRAPWSVTHALTGFTVQRDIRSKARALALVKELATLGCWDFTDPEAVKGFSLDLLTAIHAMRRRACA